MHVQVAEAALKIDSAEMHYYRVADEMDKWAESGEYMDRPARVKALG